MMAAPIVRGRSQTARKDSRVRALHNPAPSGFGGALNTGFSANRYDLVGLIIADGEFHPTDLPRFLAAIEAADLVAALVPNRTHPLYRNFCPGVGGHACR